MPTQTPAPEPTKITIADLDIADRKRLKALMSTYLDLGEQIDELTEEQERLKKEKIIPLHNSIGVDVIREQGDGDGGWYIETCPGRPSVDKEKVARYLVDHKVNPDLVKKAFIAGTSKGKPFVKIDRGLRGKKKGGE